MPSAAVPAYLGGDYADASPGMRFGIYLPIWTDSWERNDQAARKVWQKITQLRTHDVQLMTNLLARQEASAASLEARGVIARLDAVATSPFVTGLGNEHPLENGFAFLSPYGLPYLPGSGVKGVLRRAADELAGGEWGENRGWDAAAINALFGKQCDAESETHQRGALSFWDVIPQIEGNSLAVEIMTPHQSHYYQWQSADAGVAPHDSGQPNPICFLTVPPKSRFVFHVQCDLAFLQRLAPSLAREGHWQVLLHTAFEHAFNWLGFGAKTAVGYGAFCEDVAAREARAREQQQARERQQREAEREAAVRGLPEDAAWVLTRARDGAWPDNGAFVAEIDGFLSQARQLSAACIAEIAKQMQQRLPGIMSNPDAVSGRRQKPVFTDRQRALAKRLLALSATAS